MQMTQALFDGNFIPSIHLPTLEPVQCTKDMNKLWPAIQMYKKAFLATTDCELWTFTLQYNTGNLIHTILLWNSIFHVECTTLQVIATCSVSSLCGLVSTLIFGLH